MSLPAFAPLWLNEVQADNLTGITNSAGERGGWLELYNPTTNLVSLSNLCLSVTYTNLAQWTFPADAVIAPNEFKVVFADGQLALSSSNELHTGFALSSGAGALVLSQLDTNGQSRVLDYLNYTNLGPNHSYGSFPDGQSFLRQEFFYATPGSSNDGGKPIPVAINEWMAGNTHTHHQPHRWQARRLVRTLQLWQQRRGSRRLLSGSFIDQPSRVPNPPGLCHLSPRLPAGLGATSKPRPAAATCTPISN